MLVTCSVSICHNCFRRSYVPGSLGLNNIIQANMFMNVHIKCWSPAFSPFQTMFSTLLTTEIIILARFNLSSANALNLLKNVLFCKELNTCNLKRNSITRNSCEWSFESPVLESYFNLFT